MNGAMVSEMGTGKTVHVRAVEEGLAREVMEFFGGMGHAVLLLADDGEERMPKYFMSDHGPPHRGTVEWLLVNRMKSTVVSDLPEEHREHLVRLGVIVNLPEAAGLVAEVERRFGGRVESHSIYSPYYDCQIIEVFAKGTSKWSGIEKMAEEMGFEAERVIAIGDDVNDVPMFRGAALSFAMGNALPGIQKLAKRVTGRQEECGVAMVIEELLAGRLG